MNPPPGFLKLDLCLFQHFHSEAYTVCLSKQSHTLLDQPLWIRGVKVSILD